MDTAVVALVSAGQRGRQVARSLECPSAPLFLQRPRDSHGYLGRPEAEAAVYSSEVSPHVTATEMLLFADIESCLHRCHTEHTIQLIITSETSFILL